MKPAALWGSQESRELCIVSTHYPFPLIDGDFPQRLADTSGRCAILSRRTCLMRSSRPVKWNFPWKKNHSQIHCRTGWCMLSWGKKNAAQNKQEENKFWFSLCLYEHSFYSCAFIHPVKHLLSKQCFYMFTLYVNIMYITCKMIQLSGWCKCLVFFIVFLYCFFIDIIFLLHYVVAVIMQMSLLWD